MNSRERGGERREQGSGRRCVLHLTSTVTNERSWSCAFGAHRRNAESTYMEVTFATNDPNKRCCGRSFNFSSAQARSQRAKLLLERAEGLGLKTSQVTRKIMRTRLAAILSDNVILGHARRYAHRTRRKILGRAE